MRRYPLAQCVSEVEAEMRPKSLLLLAFIAWTAVAVEHEDQHRDLRLERQLGDDVPLDPESQERLVRIARQMGAIVTTEPSIHVTQTLARPTIVIDEVDSADWELVAPTKEGETPDRTVQERIQRKPRKINLKSSPLVEWRTGQLLPKDSLSETVTSAEKKSIGRYFETIKNRIGSLKSIDFPKAEFRSIWSHTEPEDLASAQFRAEGREDGDPLRERLWTIPSKRPKPQQQLQGKKPDRKPSRKKRPYQGVSTSKPSRYIATPATQTITSFPSPNETAVEHAFTAASTLLDNDDASETTLTSQNTSEMQTLTPLEASVDKYTRVPYKMPSFAGLLTHDEVDKVMSIDEKTKNILQQLAALNLYQELPMEVEADEDDARLSLDDSTTQQNEESIIDDRDEGAVVDCSREVHYSVYEGTDPTARHQLRQELFVGSGSNAAFNGQSSVIASTVYA